MGTDGLESFFPLSTRQTLTLLEYKANDDNDIFSQKKKGCCGAGVREMESEVSAHVDFSF